MTQHGMRPYEERLANGQPMLNPNAEQQAGRPDLNAQHQALQVLTMAQRTAEEHLDGARREAEQIRAGAHAEAAQIVSKAQAHADALHDQAEKIIAEARAEAESIAQSAEAFAGETERNASDMLAEAQGRSEKIVQQARASAHDIKQRAEQIYEDVVGGLTAKRQALQQQIEALERFDHEYRSRLTGFMQQQMRALWVSQPQVEAEAEVEEAEEVVEPMRQPVPGAPGREVPHIRAKGLDRPQQPAALSYSAPSEDGEAEVKAAPVDDPYSGIGRNADCPCGSGKKFKKCHGAPGGPTGLTARIS